MYPNISGNLLGFTFSITAYSLFTWVGAIIGTITALPFLKREGLKVRRSLIMLFAMAIAFLIGARLFNFVINPGAYGGNLHIYTLRLKGLAVYGGIIGAFLVLLIFAHLFKLSPLPLLDALVLPAGLAFALARVGCFLNGCCVGIATKSPLGMAFPLTESQQAALDAIEALLSFKPPEVLLLPTQLFEMGLALLGLVVVMWIYLKKSPPSGGPFLMYGIWFSAMRLIILPLRSLPYPDWVTHFFYPVFYVSLILLGSFGLLKLYRNHGKPKQIL